MVTTTLGSTSVTLEWGSVTEAEGYRATLYNDAAGLNLLQDYAAANNPAFLTVTKTGLTPGTTYYRKVSAMVGGVIVGDCAIVAFTTSA